MRASCVNAISKLAWPRLLLVFRPPATAQPAADGRARYTVLVRNEGRTASSVFSVGFAVGDQTQPTQAVQSLVPGEGRVLTFAAPRCSRSAPVRVTVDPDLAVDEADETNNTRTVVCPL